MLGSPSYIAPERIRGERATPASDLWALGATLFAAVEGSPPFHRTDPVAVFGAVLAEEPVITAKAGALRPVIDGLLCKQPARRMSAGVAEAILIAVGGEGPVPWDQRRTPDPTRRDTPAVSTGTLLLPSQPSAPSLRPFPAGSPQVAGWGAFAGAALMAAGTVLTLLGARHPGAELVKDGWPYVLGTLGVLALVAVAHVLVSTGLYLSGDRGRQATFTAVTGVAGALALLAVVISVPGLIGTDRGPPVLLGVLWSVTGVWLGLSGLLVSGRSRAVALAGEAAAGLWILLIAVPTLSPAGRTLALLASLGAYGFWAVGVGRLLSRSRSSRSGGLGGPPRSD